MDIKLTKIDSKFLLQIGKEFVEISDYKLQSSADGVTELCITIKGVANLFDLSTNLEELMKMRRFAPRRKKTTPKSEVKELSNSEILEKIKNVIKSAIKSID